LNGNGNGNSNSKSQNTDDTDRTEKSRISKKRCSAYPCWFGEIRVIRVLAFAFAFAFAVALAAAATAYSPSSNRSIDSRPGNRHAKPASRNTRGSTR
jgi:hypothetical protein